MECEGFRGRAKDCCSLHVTLRRVAPVVKCFMPRAASHDDKSFDVTLRIRA